MAFMAKFYSRNGGVRLSQMPTNFHLGDALPMRDVLAVSDYGDRKRFDLRVFARDADHAVRILMGVIRTVYPGIVISDSMYDLFGGLYSGDGYFLTDFHATAILGESGDFTVAASGILNYNGGGWR